MTKINRPPCIRGLRQFKNGCPCMSWSPNFTDGCVAWIEKGKVPLPDGSREDVKECLDMWMFRLAWTQCGLLEGNQQATESFRNNMHDATGAMLQIVADEAATKKNRMRLASADNSH